MWQGGFSCRKWLFEYAERTGTGYYGSPPRAVGGLPKPTSHQQIMLYQIPEWQDPNTPGCTCQEDAGGVYPRGGRKAKEGWLTSREESSERAEVRRP